ncbi:helix-turn-helix domain-containing protein [Halorientalis halophila]|uniref:helix-turn-helix domain-containing protein n=1 Tax=Halorientalis halophila TaxID=3108499 RepID=UPI00300B2A61
MRYAEIVVNKLEPTSPTEELLAASEDVTREQLHHLDLLDDGTATTLYEMSGDVDRVREIAADDDALIDYQISEGEERITVYAHFEPTDTLTELLELVRTHELILDMPLEYTDRGDVRALVIGQADTFQDVLARIPDTIDVELERIGDYRPESERLFAQLTQRQQETLLAALEIGYYETPRQASQRDVADYLDRSDGTVGEHLRKVESAVLSAIAPRSPATRFD